MSSRALRKLQREQELEKQIAAAQAEHEDTEDNDEDEAEQEDNLVSKPRNVFDLLEGSEDQEEPIVEEPSPERQIVSDPTSITSKPKKKKKKKQKKAKDRSTQVADDEASEDEIDKALKELAARNAHQDDYAAESLWEVSATKLLAIDQRHLDPVNEMRSLFGNIALENESRSQARQVRQREAAPQGGVDLETALSGRYNVASKGKELGALAKRRNAFVQGKEVWPLAANGGLGMEHLSDQGFDRRYNILHNQLYQETQSMFNLAVDSMQADNMISLLVRYPYHVATLLQVSEIAKHQGDHSLAGDLLERALFAYGRSAPASFSAAFKDGTLRMAFDVPANRELYLTIWRYMRSLEQRGTWRTAFEWAKLLLQLDTSSDPYGVTLMIDQSALRGRQHEQLLQLAADDAYGNAWRHLPNIQISLALAHIRSNNPKEGRKQLAIAMHKYPYILGALATELDISPLPKPIWGKQPATDAEKLYTQLYVTRAKDLWNTPETINLVVEVGNTLQFYKDAIDAAPPAAKLEVSLEEARHVFLLETPALLALLPRQFTAMPTSSSDVLPPQSSNLIARAPGHGAGPSTLRGLLDSSAAASNAASGVAGGLLQRIINYFTPDTVEGEPNGPNREAQAQAVAGELREMLGGQEVTDEMVEQMLALHFQEADEGEEDFARGLGMVGGWDYYEEAANAPSQSESMPELEGEDEPVPPRDPRAARVEEIEDEESETRPQQSGPSRSLLRHIDSDDEGQNSHPTRPPPSHTPAAPVTRPARPNPETSSAETASSGNGVDESDPQRVQRWLIGAGLSELQSNSASIGQYVARLKLLSKAQQAWIVSMAKQRAGKEMADMISSAL